LGESNPKTKDVYYFKFVTEEKVIDINCVSSKANDKIYSLTVNTDDYKNFDEKDIEKLYNAYTKSILDEILANDKKKKKKTNLKSQI